MEFLHEVHNHLSKGGVPFPAPSPMPLKGECSSLLIPFPFGKEKFSPLMDSLELIQVFVDEVVIFVMDMVVFDFLVDGALPLHAILDGGERTLYNLLSPLLYRVFFSF